MTVIIDGTNGVQSVSGSATLASITNINDTNTGMFFPASETIALATSGSERLRIDSSGNAGLGVTPSAWATVTPVLELKNGVHFAAINTTTPIGYLGANCFYNGSNWIYKTSSQNAVRYELNAGGNGSSAWFTAPTGTAGNTITFTQAMTLDASGNLAIGTASPGYTAANRNAVVVNGTTSSIFALMSGGTNRGYFYADSTDTTLWSEGSRNLTIGTASSGPIIFSTNNTERARITSGGYLLVGDTTHTDGSIFTATGVTSLNAYRLSTTAAQGIFGCYSDTGGTKTVRAYIQVDGGLANYSANNVNLSDQRVKDNINPAGSYWNKIKALEIVTFRYKDQDENDQNIGVIAQQVETVAPEFVSNDGFGETPEGEEPLKTVYTTDMYHAAIKALQEAMSRIEALEAKVAAAGL